MSRSAGITLLDDQARKSPETSMCQLCQQLGLDLHKSDAPVLGGASNIDGVTWAALPGGSGAASESPGSDTVAGSTGTSSALSGGTSVRGFINSNGATTGQYLLTNRRDALCAGCHR